ncbi:MAG: methionyl-tRNA formyltransferase [Acidimicrobiales bacterium]
MISRLAFLGTPDVAVVALQALAAADHDIALVVTQPDRRRGRGSATSPSPVKAAAVELGLSVSHRVDDVRAAGAELGVVVAFGRIIKPDVLAELGMVNIHFSLLPRWRGAAPVERAILAGDAETGVCLMAVEEGLDTGGVYRQVTTPIGPHETATDLRTRLGQIGAELLVEALDTGLGEPEPQAGVATHAAKITSAELELLWTEPNEALHRIVRVGPAWTTFRGDRLQVLDARPTAEGPEPGELEGNVVGCGAGGLELRTVKPAGKGAMDSVAWLNGARPGPGERLG